MKQNDSFIRQGINPSLKIFFYVFISVAAVNMKQINGRVIELAPSIRKCCSDHPTDARIQGAYFFF